MSKPKFLSPFSKYFFQKSEEKKKQKYKSFQKKPFSTN
jgi:hypothetical protein